MRLFKITCYAIVLSITMLGCGATGPDDEEEQEPTEYELSVSTSPSDGGSVDPSGGTYEEGAEVTIEAIANEGWNFSGWSGDEESEENPLTIVMGSNTELTADFEEEQPQQYDLTISANPSEGGSVDPSGGTFNEGEEVSVEATAADGWSFTGWEGDQTSDANPLSFTINSDTDLTAMFSETAQSYSNTIELSNGSYTERLTFGKASGATAGFEDNYDEEAPPTPPAGSFYANFRIDGYNLFEDFRAVQGQRTVWELNFGMGERNSVTLSWDFSQSDYVGSLMLVDDPDNPSEEIDMSSQRSYEVTDSSVNELYIIQE